ncbi:hypothetical protein DY000_02004645 [Brassica cretica]|uniref:Uncharacterized protein n=1 Tax=Brassica cretica TaxID=69181 RepID=A0ABQ7CG89_BRACR|nr:hypothetical protein DY000_02004645 [Brassica cretica]
MNSLKLIIINGQTIKEMDSSNPYREELRETKLREDASDLCVSLQQVALNIGSDFGTSLWEVAPGSNLCVSGSENASDFVRSLWESRSGMWCTSTSCSRSGKSFQAVLVQRSL